MTLKQTITQELLDAVDEQAGLEEALRRHSRSKGPLYLALAEATSQLRKRLERAEQDVARIETRRSQLEDEVAALELQRSDRGAEVQALNHRAQEAQEELDRARGVLQRLAELERQGFTERELSRLSELLSQVAASQGAPPEEGVTQFFRTVAHYERIGSLNLEARRAENRTAEAKANARRWEAEAKQRETLSAAIGTIRTEAENYVAAAGSRVAQELEQMMSAARLVADLREQAGELGAYVRIGQAVRDRDADAWKATTRRTIEDVILGLTLWAEVQPDRQVRVQAPADVRRAFQYRLGYPLTLSEVLTWALAAVYTETQRKALTAGW